MIENHGLISKVFVFFLDEHRKKPTTWGREKKENNVKFGTKFGPLKLG